MSIAGLSQVARAASEAGFSSGDVVIATAIAWAESGTLPGSLNPEATHTNSNGTTDYGAWQINSVHKFPELASGAWKDLKTNAVMARRVKESQGWGAWSAYQGPRYYTALPLAQAATTAQALPGAKLPTDIADKVGGINPLEPIQEAAAALRWLERADTWQRVLKVALGVMFVVGGAYLLVQTAATAAALPVAQSVLGVGRKAKAVGKVIG